MVFNFSIYQLLAKKRNLKLYRTPFFLFKMNSARSSPTIHIFNLPASKPSSKPSKPSKMRGSYHPVTVRVQALTLAYCGVDIKHIEATTGMPRQTIQYWIKKARERGYNPEIDPRILPVYVEDGKRTGRPKEITEATEQAILESISKDRNGREKSSEILAFEAGISYSSVLRILKRHGYKAVKQTTKPGLTDEMKQKRLQFCLAHKDWTLEDWKNVIWTDETSVSLGQRRGAIHVWRTKDERNDPTVIRRRWKGTSDFMVWGAFSYDKKGPLHIWAPETAQDKKRAEQEITLLNQQLEPIRQAEWELNTSMARLKLRNGRAPGRAPIWKWNKKNGLLSRDSKGGVDWYRYYKVVFSFSMVSTKNLRTNSFLYCLYRKSFSLS
jgi:transposase